jgi:hypothetical protein
VNISTPLSFIDGVQEQNADPSAIAPFRWRRSFFWLAYRRAKAIIEGRSLIFMKKTPQVEQIDSG